MMSRILIVLLIHFSNQLCYSQELTIIDIQAFDCREDTTWTGACEEKCTYLFTLNRSENKFKQTQYSEIKVKHSYEEGVYQIKDSNSIYKNVYFKKTHSNYLLTKMLSYILADGSSKIIGVNSNYFLDNKYINEHTDSEIQDTMLLVKKQIKEELNSFTVSSIIQNKIVEIEYQDEKYTFIKTRANIFWSAYNSQSNDLLFRFFYPDWNILINNMMATKQKVNNDLQIIEMRRYKTYNIGRKILTPINKANLKQKNVSSN